MVKKINTPEFEGIEGIEVGKLKKITDLDKVEFMRRCYDEMIRLWDALFNQVKNESNEFHFTKDKISDTKHVYNIYVHGQHRTGMKIWFGSTFGGSTSNINLCFGNRLDPYSDNTMNEMIRCEEFANNQLALKMTMNIFGDHGAKEPKDIVLNIWKTSLSPYVN